MPNKTNANGHAQRCTCKQCRELRTAERARRYKLGVSSGPNKLAQKIVNDILDKGLGQSTFKERFPEAYRELLVYRTDMVLDAERVIEEHES